MKKLHITQHSTDGFGHQLHGLFTTMVLHGVKNYYFDADFYVNKDFSFEHILDENNEAKNYLKECALLFKKEQSLHKKEYSHILFPKAIQNIPTEYDVNTLYLLDNAYVFEDIKLNEEEKIGHLNNINNYKKYFVNQYLPPSRLPEKNIIIHSRMGDAMHTSRKDSIISFNHKLISLIKIFKAKYPSHTIFIHSDGELKHLEEHNVVFFDKKTDILCLMSDFIYANIFVSSNSSLSEVCCFLGEKEINIVNDVSLISKPKSSIKIAEYIQQNINFIKE